MTGRIWVGTVIGLEFTTNGGSTWTLLNGLTSVTELDVHGNRLAVVGRMAGDTFDHIYYSGDNGGTWNEITRPGYRFAKTEQVTVDPWRPGTVWICTGGRAVARFTPWTPVEICRNANFNTPQPTGAAAPLPDGEDDGLVNQIEYVTGTNPKIINAARPWQASRLEDRLTLTFPRNPAATDAAITVQGVDNLGAAWTDLARSTGGAPTAALIAGVGVMESGAGATRTVEVRDLYTVNDPAHPKRFMRLHVVVP